MHFFHGDLEEELYIEPSSSFLGDFHHKDMCRLKKAFYGLKQSPWDRFGKFMVAMKKYGYHKSNSNDTLFVKKGKVRLHA